MFFDKQLQKYVKERYNYTNKMETSTLLAISYARKD